MKTMHNILKLLTLLMVVTVVGCGSGERTIKPFKLEIQQGNVVTSEMLLKLRPGMTKSQVQFILGTPLLVDSFHTNRWDYFYQLRKQGEVVSQRRVILDFDDDALLRVRGDVVPEGTNIDALVQQDQPAAKPSKAAANIGPSNPDLITTPIEAPAIESTGETIISEDVLQNVIVIPVEENVANAEQMNEAIISTAQTTQPDVDAQAVPEFETAVLSESANSEAADSMSIEKITVPKTQEVDALTVIEKLPASTTVESADVIRPKLKMDRTMIPAPSDLQSRYRVAPTQSATSAQPVLEDVADLSAEKVKQGIDKQKPNAEAPGYFERILKMIGF
jgi:outer membrane protein assembly factor BamE